MLEILTRTVPEGIFLRHWKVEDPKGVVLAVHGMGTHSGRFDHFAKTLATFGYTSFCYDQPGHGNSLGKRGHFSSYDDLLNALQAILDDVKSQYPDNPVFLFGHSMGGNVVANFVIRRKPELNGVVLSAPWFKLAFNPPFFQMMLAKLVVNIFPGLRQQSKLNVNYISHDPEVLKDYDDDELIHSYITPRFFLETSKAGLYALEHASEFDLPLYMYHGTSDHITLQPASKAFADKVKSSQYKAWEGCYHEVHNEWVKEELFAQIVPFLNSKC